MLQPHLYIVWPKHFKFEQYAPNHERPKLKLIVLGLLHQRFG
jgi:hypothetical protein